MAKTVEITKGWAGRPTGTVVTISDGSANKWIKDGIAKAKPKKKTIGK